MSTGFASDASGRRIARSLLRVSSASGGSSRPFSASASAARIPGPPALVSTATRRPSGSGQRERISAASSISPIESARMIPAWRQSASAPVSPAERAPVCELAAFAPAAVLPALTRTIGFLGVMRRAISRNWSASANDSRYSVITGTSSSFSHASSRSFSLTSTLLPIETNWEKPMPRSSQRLITAQPREPDCEAKPSGPLSVGLGEKVESSATAGLLLTAPMQFGPSRRAPASRHIAASFSCSAFPSAPISPKPAVMMQIAFAPCFRHSATACSTPASGTMISARSIFSGTSSTLL